MITARNRSLDMMSTDSALGTTCLESLLVSLTMSLNPETFVFITVPPPHLPAPTLKVQMSFREAEGLTVITTRTSAIGHGLDYTFPCRMITLNVHSSLEAVGFIAVVAQRLREIGVGVNPVSGFFHDHLFVPIGREQDALHALQELIVGAKEDREKRNEGNVLNP